MEPEGGMVERREQGEGFSVWVCVPVCVLLHSGSRGRQGQSLVAE